MHIYLSDDLFAIKTCSVDGCNKPDPGNRKGYCLAHYLREYKYGSPTKGGTSRGHVQKWLNDHVNYVGDDCLIWPFARGIHGYAIINKRAGSGIASRVMCMLAHGEPPTTDFEAAHNCGNGANGCVNPNHLEWKTTLDNSHDKAVHGTQMFGEKIRWWAKLTKEQAIRIKYGKEDRISLANEFKVSPITIDYIRNGRTWKGI